MAEIDIWAIKTRIVKILKSNTTLNPAKITTKDVLRQIETGAPYINELADVSVTPAVFVTDHVRTDEIEQPVVSQNNKPNTLLHRIRLLVLVVADGKDGAESEKNVNTLVKKILEVLEANQTLRDPPSGTANLVHYSRPESVEIIDSSLVGTGKQGRAITLYIETESN